MSVFSAPFPSCPLRVPPASGLVSVIQRTGRSRSSDLRREAGGPILRLVQVRRSSRVRPEKPQTSEGTRCALPAQKRRWDRPRCFSSRGRKGGRSFDTAIEYGTAAMMAAEETRTAKSAVRATRSRFRRSLPQILPDPRRRPASAGPNDYGAQWRGSPPCGVHATRPNSS
jgi:hypothetical protein